MLDAQRVYEMLLPLRDALPLLRLRGRGELLLQRILASPLRRRRGQVLLRERRHLLGRGIVIIVDFFDFFSQIVEQAERRVPRQSVLVLVRELVREGVASDGGSRTQVFQL